MARLDFSIHLRRSCKFFTCPDGRNAGGGGERVLWAAVKATQLSYPRARSVIYTGDPSATKDEVVDKVKVGTAILDLDP